MWLTIVLATISAIVPDLCIRLIENYIEISDIEQLQKESTELENKTKNFKFLDSFLFFNNFKRHHSNSIFEKISLNTRMRDGHFSKKSDLSDQVRYSNIERIQPLVINTIYKINPEPTLNSIKELSEKQ